MKIKLSITGYKGRMGQQLIKSCKNNILTDMAAVTFQVGSSVIESVTSASEKLYDGVFSSSKNKILSTSGRPLSGMGVKPQLSS